MLNKILNKIKAQSLICKMKITFNKSQTDFKGSGWNLSWSEVSDSNIIEALTKIREKYPFSIKKVKIHGSIYESSIILKCYRKDKEHIFINFCKLLGGSIKNVKYK